MKEENINADFGFYRAWGAADYASMLCSEGRLERVLVLPVTCVGHGTDSDMYYSLRVVLDDYHCQLKLCSHGAYSAVKFPLSCIWQGSSRFMLL